MPITQLKNSMLFLNNFMPFILEQNIRQASDGEYSALLNRCRVGKQTNSDYDFL